MGFATGSLFFYGGIVGLAVALIAAIIIIIVQSGDRKRLREKLDEEYGKVRGINHKAAKTEKRAIELNLPSLDTVRQQAYNAKEESALGHTEYIFDDAPIESTEFIATEMVGGEKTKTELSD